MLLLFWRSTPTPEPPSTEEPPRIVYGLGPHQKHTVHPHPVFTTRH